MVKLPSENEVIRGEWVVVTVYPKNPLKPIMHVYGPYPQVKAVTIADEFKVINLLDANDQCLVFTRQVMKLSDD